VALTALRTTSINRDAARPWAFSVPGRPGRCPLTPPRAAP